MELSVLCCLTVALAFVPLHSAQGAWDNEKPGECPNTLELDWCIPHPMECRTDRDCKGNMKCCYNRCGRICMKPVKVGPKPNPGSCPRDDFCVECKTDRDCVRHFKCCPNGCGKVCMEPFGRYCPRLLFPLNCNECRNDKDCGRGLKCCYKTCESRRVCVKPETKPGSCPPPFPHLIPCGDECKEDSECRGNLKCCYSGCGFQCMDPEYFRG